MSSMATRFGSLCDDEVTSRINGSPSMVNLSTHACHEDARRMTRLDHIGRNAESSHEDACSTFDQELD